MPQSTTLPSARSATARNDISGARNIQILIRGEFWRCRVSTSSPRMFVRPQQDAVERIVAVGCLSSTPRDAHGSTGWDAHPQSLMRGIGDHDRRVRRVVHIDFVGICFGCLIHRYRVTRYFFFCFVPLANGREHGHVHGCRPNLR